MTRSLVFGMPGVWTMHVVVMRRTCVHSQNKVARRPSLKGRPEDRRLDAQAAFRRPTYFTILSTFPMGEDANFWGWIRITVALTLARHEIDQRYLNGTTMLKGQHHCIESTTHFSLYLCIEPRHVEAQAISTPTMQCTWPLA